MASSISVSTGILASCTLISQHLHSALTPMNSLPILYCSKWRCLANSSSVVLKDLITLFQHACSFLGPMEQENMCSKLARPLHALHRALQEAYECMQDFTPGNSISNHSWLVDKALKLGLSTDVVDVHLHDLLWTSSTVRMQIMRFVWRDGNKSDLLQQTSELCQIWEHVDPEDDLVTAQSLLRKITGEEKIASQFLNKIEEAGETLRLAEEEGATSRPNKKIKGKEKGGASHLADFILQKLSLAESSDATAETQDILPPYLWVNPEELQRKHEILGVGGYGKVYEATWMGGRFAVKDFFYVESNVVFGREAVIQARLRHPNVMPLVCCTKSPHLQKCSLVMELMQQDLRVLIMQRNEAGMDPPFTLVEAVDIMLQTAKGMEYLHSLHIMHRDLKSSNILVSFPRECTASSLDGLTSHVHLRIADFGMSKAKYDTSRYTTRQTGATPWRAPEVFESDDMEDDPNANAKYTNKADVYSFGLVCYEILTGNFPFEGPQVRKRVLAGERPQLPSYCPPALASYIKWCWHANPNQRPTFTQICRILRYLKACILLDHDEEDLLCWPIVPSMCAKIDDMVQSVGALQPQPLNIPFEMYCCRAVLEDAEHKDNTLMQDVGGREILEAAGQHHLMLVQVQHYPTADRPASPPPLLHPLANWATPLQRALSGRDGEVKFYTSKSRSCFVRIINFYRHMHLNYRVLIVPEWIYQGSK